MLMSISWIRNEKRQYIFINIPKLAPIDRDWSQYLKI